MSGPQPNLLSVAEFAAAIGKAERQVYRYVKRGQVSVLSEEINGRTVVRIPQSEVERFSATAGVERLGDTASGHLSGPNGQAAPEVHVVTATVVRESDMDDEDDGVYRQPAVPLDRHESVVMRLGWLEAQLEMNRRMLGDGGAREQELRERLEREAQARREAEMRAAEASSRVDQLARELDEARKQLGVPWWKRLLSTPVGEAVR